MPMEVNNGCDEKKQQEEEGMEKKRKKKSTQENRYLRFVIRTVNCKFCEFFLLLIERELGVNEISELFATIKLPSVERNVRIVSFQ